MFYFMDKNKTKIITYSISVVVVYCRGKNKTHNVND